MVVTLDHTQCFCSCLWVMGLFSHGNDLLGLQARQDQALQLDDRCLLRVHDYLPKHVAAGVTS